MKLAAYIAFEKTTGRRYTYPLPIPVQANQASFDFDSHGALAVYRMA
jgi:hypothetical protein